MPQSSWIWKTRIRFLSVAIPHRFSRTIALGRGAMIQSTMQRVPLSLNNLLERAGRLYPDSEIVSCLPDKSLVRHRFADFYRRSRALAAALIAAGLEKGDRVATLC